MKVSVLGTGYVGLVSGVCLAEKGHDVLCVDIDQKKVDLINQGVPPIFEKGLEDLLKKNVGVRLRATTNLSEAVRDTEVSLIAVGTPFNGSEIDLTYIMAVSEQIGQALRDKPSYHLVVVKSTVVPGTTDEVVRPIVERASGKSAGRDFGVGMNPEFLTEGEAVSDFMYPDRIVIGGQDSRSLDVLDRLYGCFPGVPVLKTNNKTAEMIKYTSNSLLAAMISFSNEIGNLCGTLGGIDVLEVMKGVHLSRYLTAHLPNGETVAPGIISFLAAGCGFGGSCLPKDVSALVAQGDRAGSAMPLLESVLQINRAQPQKMFDLLGKHFSSLKGVHVAVLGLAFRPDTNDMRESPAIPIIHRLVREQAVVKAYDPIAKHEAEKVFQNGGVQICESLNQAIDGADAIVVITRWDEFRRLPELLRGRSAQPVVIDGRRMLDKQTILKYEGIGLG